MQFKLIFSLFFLSLTLNSLSQRIVYSEVDPDDSRRMTFEVIGKVSGNFLIYKNTRGKNYIAVYNNAMEQVAKEEQAYISDRVFNIDFFPYSGFAYLIYQYQKKNVVYCDAVKVDGNGKKISDVITIDTSHIGFTNSNKIYSAISSEDKSKLMVFKINSKNKSYYTLTTLLLNQQLEIQKKTRFGLAMEEYHDYLDEFNLDNDGDLVFSKFNRNNNESINKTLLVWKPSLSDSVFTITIPQDKMFLDEPHIKVDNVNNRYFLTSFYYTKKRGNIEGFYFYVWDKNSRKPVLQNSLLLNEELRADAKSDNSNIKTAFNDYFIRNIIIKKDGGFLINAESYYTTSRYNSWNRLNYLYGMPYSSMDYYSSYSPYYNSWWNRSRFDNSQNVRYHADNITVLSFDKNGALQWSGVVHKEQFDDQSEERISYQTMNTGGQIHYLFNVDEKRALLLNDFTLSPQGEINHNPTLKNLDRGYEFMPKFGKQVSSYQSILPCYYRNNICFAKIEFNQ